MLVGPAQAIYTEKLKYLRSGRVPGIPEYPLAISSTRSVERAGSRALSIFTHALSPLVLRAHVDGPLRRGELEGRLGWAPQSSLRAAIGKMRDLGALARAGHEEGGPGAATALTVAGRELLGVADALERWLAQGPDGPVALGDAAGRGVVSALAAAWDSAMIRALAERPRALSELNAAIRPLNYPALKRRLARLRSTRLVTPVEADGGTTYTVSGWLRRAVVPLALLCRWERRHAAGAVALSSSDLLAILLLALPLVGLPGRASGVCALAVLSADDPNGSPGRAPGVNVEVERGAVTCCDADAPADPATWALGNADAWLEALIEGRHETVHLRGPDQRLAGRLVTALYADLFRAPEQPTGSRSQRGLGSR
jgi:DNA-binding HxlR family transcriptional regulator